MLIFYYLFRFMYLPPITTLTCIILVAFARSICEPSFIRTYNIRLPPLFVCLALRSMNILSFKAFSETVTLSPAVGFPDATRVDATTHISTIITVNIVIAATVQLLGVLFRCIVTTTKITYTIK